jgi:hypothetical protein
LRVVRVMRSLVTLGPFEDVVGSPGGVQLFRGRSVIGFAATAITRAMYDGQHFYVTCAVARPRLFARYIVQPSQRSRPLPSLWDWLCVVHGPQPSRSEGTCRTCGKACFLRIIWRDPDAVEQIIGPVSVYAGRITYGPANRIFEPGEVTDVYIDGRGNVYAKVLLYEPLEVEAPPDLTPAEVAELVWTPPQEVVLGIRR